MSITRTKTDWSFGERLTSAQVDAIDTNVTNALDKRSGQTDTLESDVTVTGDLALNGANTVGGATTFNNGVTLNSAVSFGASSTVGGTTTVAAAITLAGTITGGTITGATITGGSVGAASGIATLNSSSKLTASQRVGTMVGCQTVGLSTLETTTSVSFVDVSALDISFADTEVGDIVTVDGRYVGQVDASTLRIAVRVVDGGNNVDNLPGSAAKVEETAADSALYVYAPTSFSYTVTTGGTLIVRTRIASSSGGQVGLRSFNELPDTTVRAILFRP